MKNIRKRIWVPTLIGVAILFITLSRRHGALPVAENPVPAQKPAVEAKVEESPVVEQPIAVVPATNVEQVAQATPVPEAQATPAVDTSRVKKVRFTIKPRPPQMKVQ